MALSNVLVIAIYQLRDPTLLLPHRIVKGHRWGAIQDGELYQSGQR